MPAGALRVEGARGGLYGPTPDSGVVNRSVVVGPLDPGDVRPGLALQREQVVGQRGPSLHGVDHRGARRWSRAARGAEGAVHSATGRVGVTGSGAQPSRPCGPGMPCGPGRTGRTRGTGRARRALLTAEALLARRARQAVRTARALLATLTGRALLTHGPWSPVGPTSPRGPCSPVGPCSPIGPIGPIGPTGPCSPVGPGRPIGPIGPCSPDRPVRPCSPRSPGRPLSPGSPFGPACRSPLLYRAGPARPAGPARATTSASVRPLPRRMRSLSNAPLSVVFCHLVLRIEELDAGREPAVPHTRRDATHAWVASDQASRCARTPALARPRLTM